eukprot:TRINITY_DN6015_c0_g1_i1.p1 TRINITY_DN6015_c0_g1~~TRINITY_DN6015_c0_g1_i1.p1  ORF type:complete len:222 (-),score=54.23 TRINITY_DN6015_c0_g1_i1:17-682(-)
MADGFSEMSFEEVQSARPDDLESVATDSQWIMIDTEEEEEEEEGDEVPQPTSTPLWRVEADEKIRQMERAQVPQPPAARLLTCDLILGNNAGAEVPGFCGQDLTKLCAPALQAFPTVTSARCLGRVAVAGTGQPLPAVSRAIVQNCGAEAWPAGTTLQIVAGDSFGFDSLFIGPLEPGQGAALHLDFSLRAPPPEGCRSCWVLVDEQGEPFGPLLALEVCC